jgi:tetratricopeptide (TPR) repeat protein
MAGTDSTQNNKSFKDRLEQHPLATVFVVMLGSVLTTAAAMNWINGDYTRNKHEAELATVRSQYESRIRDLEDKIRDMEADSRKSKVEPKQSGSSLDSSQRPISTPNSSSATSTSNRANAARASAFISKARSLYAKKEYQAAINECDKALRIDPKNETARQLRAEIQNTMKILNPQ